MASRKRSSGLPAARFVLRYQGEGPAPGDDVARVRNLGSVLDESARMLLVEADPGTLGELVGELSNWVMAPDRSYPVPDGRKRIGPPPG